MNQENSNKDLQELGNKIKSLLEQEGKHKFKLMKLELEFTEEKASSKCGPNQREVLEYDHATGKIMRKCRDNLK